MKKIIAGLIGSCLLISNLSARDDVYVGVEYGVAFYNAYYVKSSYEPDLGDQTGSSTYQTLKLGKYFGSHRISLDVDGGSSIGFGYDYFFDTKLYDFSPYIGTGLSYHNTKYINADAESSSMIIPLTLGLEYIIDDKFTVDVGIRLQIGRYYSSSYYSEYSYRKRDVFLSILYSF